MSDLIVVAYDEEGTAQEVLVALLRLQVGYLMSMDDAVYVTRDKDGKVQLHQTVPFAAESAGRGALLGALIGLLFFVPLLGMALGAGAGYLTTKMMGDLGINDTFAKQLGEKLQPGTSALLILVRTANADKVLPEVSKYGGDVLHTSLPSDAEERLKAALAQA
jgi:uncharacterized membrane protein